MTTKKKATKKAAVKHKAHHPKGETYCAGCGKTVEDKKATNCPGCGHALEVTEAKYT